MGASLTAAIRDYLESLAKVRRERWVTHFSFDQQAIRGMIWVGGLDRLLEARGRWSGAQMCEHCSGKRIWKDPLDEGDQCELEDSEGVECSLPARWRIRERFVSSHLCDEHAAALDSQLRSGLGDSMRESGFQESSELLPIHGGANCQQIIRGRFDLDIGGWQDLELCDRRATYADSVVWEARMCDEHSEAYIREGGLGGLHKIS